MKKGVTWLLLGFLFGVAAALATPAYGAVKQYVLTEFSHPVIVDGVQYKDKQNPILVYNGRTYIPLAKIGDLTGINYQWNAVKKQVEISKPNSTNDVTTIVHENGDLRDADAVIAERDNIKDFTDGKTVEVNKESKLVAIGKNDDGSDIIGFEAHDKSGKLLGTYSDEDDIELVIARIEKRAELPPKLSDGWISAGLLSKIYGFDIVYDKNDLVFKTSAAVVQQKEYLRLNLPEGWATKVSGEITIKEVTVHKYNSNTYFRIDEIKKSGLI